MKNKAAVIAALNNGEMIQIAPASGFNNIALYATPLGASHRYEAYGRIIVKFCRKDRGDAYVAEILDFHKNVFPRLNFLVANPNFQQSIDSGVYTDKFGKNYAYVILQFIEGSLVQDLLDTKSLSRQSVLSILHQMLFDILIPLWELGLRFSDIHGRNFVLRSCGQLVLIDLEQMRKSAHELLLNPTDWSCRAADNHLAFHGAVGRVDYKGRLVVFIKNVIEAATVNSDAVLDFVQSEFFKPNGLSEWLSKLGMDKNAKTKSREIADDFLAAVSRLLN